MISDLDIKTLRELREKPSRFVEVLLDDPVSKNDLKPYPYQREFLDDPHERKVIVAGRQVGKTTVMAWLALHEFAMFPNRRILIVSPTKRQAKNFMQKLKGEIAHWLRDEDAYGLQEVMKMRIEGKNGSWIQAVPALEETIRGLTIDSAFVDEAAFIERQVFTSVVSPMLATTDGQFVLGSTPWGKEGYLFDKFDDDDYWNEYRVSSMENPEIDARQIEEWRRDMTSMEFDREVLGLFSEKKNAFFKNKDISRCLEWAKKEDVGENVVYPDREGRDCYMAVDPATKGEDTAVITSIDTEGNVFDIKEFPDIEIPELEGEIRSLLNDNSRNYLKGRIEENGIGEGTVHRFEREFREIEGFRATLRSKESVYQQAKNEMQSGNISIPDHEMLKKQLRSMEYEMTQRGNKKIHAPEGKHDDYADSFVLAVACMTGKGYVDRQAKAYRMPSTSQKVTEKRLQDKRSFSFN